MAVRPRVFARLARAFVLHHQRANAKAFGGLGEITIVRGQGKTLPHGKLKVRSVICCKPVLSRQGQYGSRQRALLLDCDAEFRKHGKRIRDIFGRESVAPLRPDKSVHHFEEPDSGRSSLFPRQEVQDCVRVAVRLVLEEPR